MAFKGIVSRSNYSFNAAAKTITFSNDYLGMSLSDITYITNIKNGVAAVIYDPFDAAKGGTLNGLTLTLNYNTTAMANDDPLQIIVGFTPTLPDPSLVKLVPDSLTTDQTQLLQNISDQLDYVATSLDQAEGVQVNIRDSNPAKRDINNAQIPSDGVTYTTILRRVNDALTLDTSGYNSVDAQLWGDNAVSGISFTCEGSSEGINWSGIPFVEPSISTTALTLPGSGFTLGTNSGRRVIIPATTKFVRIRLTGYSAGSIHVTANLRQQSLPTGPFTQIPVSANVFQLNSAAPNLNGTTLANSQTQIAGGISISGYTAPTQNPPNAAQSLQLTLPYPIGIGGREQPYVGALGGIFRYLTVDGGGRYILGGDTPDTETRTQSRLATGAIPGIPPRGVGGISNNMLGSQSLTVNDTQQAEGDTHTMLLKQILQELKILNQQFIELPFLLNAGESTMSDPQEYRNDNSNLF